MNELAMVFRIGDGFILPAMTKRVVSTALWFYAGWYAGAMVAALFGISPALGPIFAVAAAGIIGGDPRGIIWGPTRTAGQASPAVLPSRPRCPTRFGRQPDRPPVDDTRRPQPSRAAAFLIPRDLLGEAQVVEGAVWGTAAG